MTQFKNLMPNLYQQTINNLFFTIEYTVENNMKDFTDEEKNSAKRTLLEGMRK